MVLQQWRSLGELSTTCAFTNARGSCCCLCRKGELLAADQRLASTRHQPAGIDVPDMLVSQVGAKNEPAQGTWVWPCWKDNCWTAMQ